MQGGDTRQGESRSAFLAKSRLSRARERSDAALEKGYQEIGVHCLLISNSRLREEDTTYSKVERGPLDVLYFIGHAYDSYDSYSP